MNDPRYKKLADVLVNYSMELQPGERVLLDLADAPDEFAIELIRSARAAKATPLVEMRHTRVSRELLRGIDAKQANLVRDVELFRMKKVQGYVAIRGAENASENSDVAGDRMALYSRTIRPVLDYRVNK